MYPTHDTEKMPNEKPSSPDDLYQVTTYSKGQCEELGGTQTLQFGDEGGTQRGIKSRHAQMLAIGGIIGTGLFVGAGQGLAVTGPLTLLLAYAIICVFVYTMVTATTEVSTF